MGYAIGQVCRRFSWLLVFLAAFLVAREANALTDVCYKGGALLPNFKLNNAATLNGTDLIVTTSAGNQVGSIMYLPKFDAANDIHIKLQVKISLAGNGGADGMAFIMHNAAAAASAIGSAGGGIGYQTITPSVAVEFDTYFNSGSDPNANHIAITRNGDTNHTSVNNNVFPAPVTAPVDMKSGNPVFLWIDWNHTTKVLTAYISATSTKPVAATMTANSIDLATLVGSTFYVGFTGSTGGSWNQHEVVELYASDHNADPTTACCDTNTNCTGNAAGPVCDPNKHLCGQCTVDTAGSCSGATPACSLAASSNSCAASCTGDNGSAGANPCGSTAFPACNGSGSCTTCKGDYLTSATIKCLATAPYCSANGYCGRCTANADCSASGATHLGAVCNTTTGACVGTCATAADCGTGNYCASGTCAPLVVNGGTCGATGAASCASAICDTDNKCGYNNGAGTCTAGTAATRCRSGVCGTSSLKCIPAGGSGCAADGDCTTGNFCNGSTLTCTPKLTNGTTLITPDTLHNNGTCNPAAGTAVCASGVCDTVDNKCGYANPNGTCTVGNQATVCRSGVCGTDSKCGYVTGSGTCTAGNGATVCRSGICGTTSLMCVPSGGSGCLVDGDCSATTYCNGTGRTCVPKLANTVSIPSDGLHLGACTPQAGAAVCTSGVCDTDNKCGYVNGFGTCNGTTAAVVCRGGACGSDSKCGLPNGAGACTVGTAASICRSGACGGMSSLCVPSGGSGCGGDPDCAPGSYCNGTVLLCMAQQPNGGPVSTDPLHPIPCTISSSTVLCQSGVCDADSRCGFANGDGTCNAGNAAVICRSTVCGGDSHCGYSDGTGTCTPLTAAAVCRSGVCGTTSGKCVPLGGTGCGSDSDCVPGTYCNGSTFVCATKVVNGDPLPSDGLHDGTCTPSNATATCVSGQCDTDNKCGFGNGHGVCNATDAVAICRSSVCGSDSKCGYSDGTGSCTPANAGTVCRSGLCGASSGMCIPSGVGGCGSDPDCGTGNYCNGTNLTCSTKVANGDPLPNDGLHDGTCNSSSGAAVCASGVCDADNKCGLGNGKNGCTTSAGAVCRSGICDSDDSCGYADGRGTCTSSNAAVLCRSGVCGESSKACIPSGGLGCTLDTDCAAGKFCAFATLTCAPLLTNGTALPSDGLHNGTCAGPLALAVCASGACDAADGKCGIALGDATCATTSQCRTGVCIATGTNASKCEPCAQDADCGSATAACDVPTNQCVVCTASNAAACSGNTPLCNLTTHQCAACGGDRAASGVTLACNVEASPFCASNGSCGKCTTNADCVGSGHGGVICNPNSGACGAACTSDTDCSGKWCDNPTAAVGGGVCEAKIADGQSLPSDAPVNATCTSTAGMRVCVSGTCDMADNRCGLPNGRACAMASECRSGSCNGDGKCGIPNGGTCTSSLASACRSGICDTDQKCGSGNGDHCGASTDCRSGICVAVDATCGALGGTGCTDDASCRAGVCFTDGKCGLPNGGVCEAGSSCRSGACVSGQCVAGCTRDADCAGGTYCKAGGTCGGPLLVNGETCDRGAVCKAGVCGSDGKCGASDGTTCTNDTTCRTGVCSNGSCGTVCAANADCAEGFYCKAAACVAVAVNGATCTTASECSSGICAADGKCGVANNLPCASATVCRSGICGANGNCGGTCATNTECVVGTYCNTTTSACVSSVPNGMGPTDGACVPAQCQSGVCGTDNKCGSSTGEVCGANAACQAGVCDPVDGRCGFGNGHGVCSTDTAAIVCRTGVCDTSDGKCGLADGSGTCTTATATVCRSGMCGAVSMKCVAMAGNGCEADGDCGVNGYCDGKTKTCKTKLTNGMPIPTDGMHDGTCATGGAACSSGSCDPKDNMCGLGNDSGPCSADGNCRGGKCITATQKCAACLADTDCTGAGGYCDGVSGTCKTPVANGETCDRNTQCTANACGSDKLCGKPQGESCVATFECRAGQCSAGICLAVTTGNPADTLRVSGGGCHCAVAPAAGEEWAAGGLFALGALALLGVRRRKGR